MFSGIILGLGLAGIGMIIYYLHREHGPGNKKH